MSKLLFLVFLFVSAGLGQLVAAQTTADVPPRPTPFHFVNDEASLMAPADVKKLESGLRRYAENTGTQVVVVTVPSLGGRNAADYGRAIGTAWGVGQRDKNNGVVVLISAQDRKLSIEPGSGLQSAITPEVTKRIIGQMGPSFKQGNYFLGLRTGLNTLMLAANPSSNPRKQGGAAGATSSTGVGATESAPTNLSQENTAPMRATDPVLAAPPTEPVSSGPGIGTLLIGALVVGGIIWFLVRMFRGRSAAANNPGNPNNMGNQGNPGNAPDFLPNRNNGPGGNNGPNRGPAGNYGPGNGPGYGNAPNSGGMGGIGGIGMGGILATGAAAAAGAYIGNRMSDSGHDNNSGNNLANDGSSNASLGAGAAGAAGGAGTDAGSDYFAGRDGGGAENTAPDYFTDDNTAADNSSDYFSSDDNSSFDDTSSDDTGGGGFDSDSDNSGSW